MGTGFVILDEIQGWAWLTPWSSNLELVETYNYYDVEQNGYSELCCSSCDLGIGVVGCWVCMACCTVPCPSHPTNSWFISLRTGCYRDVLTIYDVEQSGHFLSCEFSFKRSFHIYQQKPWAEVGANCRELLVQGLLEDFNMATCGFILKLGGWRSGAAKRSKQLGKMHLHMVTCTNSTRLASN